MGQDNLPIEADGLEGWQGEAPDPEANPEFYERVVVSRPLAYLVDLVVIVVLTGALMLVFSVLGLLTFGLLTPFLWAALALVPLLYHTLLIGGGESATFGMRLFKIEVRTWEGRRPGYLQAALMTIVFYVTVALTSWLVLVVALFNRRRRTLHDFLCGTLVINNVGWDPVYARRV